MPPHTRKSARAESYDDDDDDNITPQNRTGYFVHELDAALESVDARAVAVLQSTPSPWTLWDGVVRSEVVGFENRLELLDALFADQDETQGNPMERALFVAARRLRDEQGLKVDAFPRLQAEPTINSEQNQLITEL